MKQIGAAMATTDPQHELADLPAGEQLNLDAVLVFNVVRTHSRLAPLIDADLRQRRLTASQFNTLLVLRMAGEAGLRMSEIGERLVVTRSNVTRLVDGLERQGLVARGEHADRRATVVRLTSAGAKLVARTLPGHRRRLAELTDCLSRTEKQTLVRLLSKLRRELRHRKKGRD